MLIENGHSVNEKIDGDSLLAWALLNERGQVIEWLLDRGADPNVGRGFGDAPLKMAINGANTAVTLNLMRHGADPAPFIYDIAGLPPAQREQKRSVMLAAVESLKYIPEEFLLDALRSDPPLLERFVESQRAAGRVPCKHWIHAG